MYSISHFKKLQIDLQVFDGGFILTMEALLLMLQNAWISLSPAGCAISPSLAVELHNV